VALLPLLVPVTGFRLWELSYWVRLQAWLFISAPYFLRKCALMIPLVPLLFMDFAVSGVHFLLAFLQVVSMVQRDQQEPTIQPLWQACRPMNTHIDAHGSVGPHDGAPSARAETAVLIDKGRVAKRQQVLDDARSKLKSSFVGIDHVIDELCDAVAVWYTMPEVLRRPMIVNLWGMKHLHPGERKEGPEPAFVLEV